uniref:Ceramide synthase 2 n=1 Tax=Leptobrachium leishanense TaxID=445787 RepID=A0A8C5QGV2_9ANUR
MLQTLYDGFWNHYLWLPENLTWEDVEDQEDRVYAKASDLYATIPLAFVFLVVRYFFEIFVASPLGRALGVKDKVRLRVASSPTLEKFYVQTSKHPKRTDLENLSQVSNVTVRQVERWFRRRRNQDRPSLQKKFREASWRFTFYLLAFIAGLAVLVDKPWFHDLREVWKDFPKQTMLSSQYWYYMIELGFYWSLLFRVAFDVKRKDFKEQVIHHVATIILISFSWCANYIRVGTLVMAVHDASDFLLESAKMLNYAGWKETGNGIFVVFALVFIVTRIIILPFWRRLASLGGGGYRRRLASLGGGGYRRRLASLGGGGYRRRLASLGGGGYRRRLASLGGGGYRRRLASLGGGGYRRQLASLGGGGYRRRLASLGGGGYRRQLASLGGGGYRRRPWQCTDPQRHRSIFPFTAPASWF